MRWMNSTSSTLLVGVASAAFAMFSASAGAETKPLEIKTVEDARSAVFAGGCFWCVEADFDKVDGVLETVSGYIGGDSAAPTYRTHARDGHLEAVKIAFDPDQVSYEQLVSYFFRTIDPTDAGGQFCDRGNSYTTAIFAQDDRQAQIARAEIEEIEASGVLEEPVVTKVRGDATFYRAEDYHQDYYKKKPLKYQFYRQACGRDARLEEIWGKDATG